MFIFTTKGFCSCSHESIFSHRYEYEDLLGRTLISLTRFKKKRILWLQLVQKMMLRYAGTFQRTVSLWPSPRFSGSWWSCEFTHLQRGLVFRKHTEGHSVRRRPVPLRPWLWKVVAVASITFRLPSDSVQTQAHSGWNGARSILRIRSVNKIYVTFFN